MEKYIHSHCTLTETRFRLFRSLILGTCFLLSRVQNEQISKLSLQDRESCAVKFQTEEIFGKYVLDLAGVYEALGPLGDCKCCT